MSIKLDPLELDWVHDEYLSGRTIEEIAIDTGMSKQNVKRALAECRALSLSWYKTKEENEILNYLKQQDITTLRQLQKILPDVPANYALIKKLLKHHPEGVECWVSDYMEIPDEFAVKTIIHRVEYKDYPFIDEDGVSWKYATPYDPETGKPISDIPE